ncbi:MAG: HD domain-containing protein [Myxococcota bacterium]
MYDSRTVPASPRDSSFQDLVELLEALDGVEQDPRHHPEGDALYHSLQVYQHALRDGAEPALLAAALFHDVGKAVAGRDHDRVGAELTEGLPDRTRWCIAHHLDLLRNPRATRRRWAGMPQIVDLTRLRRWDLAGRSPRARVCSPDQAVAHVLEALHGDRS